MAQTLVTPTSHLLTPRNRSLSTISSSSSSLLAGDTLSLRRQLPASFGHLETGANRRHRRRPGVPRAARESPYDVLGVSRTATEKEIKRAYRKLALKYHPDVNKAADADKQFLRIKQAYQALTEPSTASSSRASSSSYSQRSSTTQRPTSNWDSSFSDFDFNWKKGPDEPFYGLDDFFRDLSKDLEKRRKEGKPKSLWQELAELGDEFVDYLEKELNITGETGGAKSQASASSSSNRASGQSSGGAKSSQRYESKNEDRYKAWADDLGKKGKEVADDVEKELQRLKKEMGL